MSTTVILTDYPRNRRATILYLDEDFRDIEPLWDKGDRLLEELKDHPVFANRVTWRALAVVHWRILIIQNLALVAQLSSEEADDDDNPVVRSLNFLMMGLIACLERQTGSTIELLRVDRVGEHDVAFSLNASLDHDLDLPKPKAGLRIVVDNTGS